MTSFWLVFLEEGSSIVLLCNSNFVYLSSMTDGGYAAMNPGAVGKGEDPLPLLDHNEYNLSRYFPSGTMYFYSFPAGEESGFFNSVPTWVEELVAGRPLLCAGPNIKVLTFAAVYAPNILGLLSEMGVSPLGKDQVIVMPEIIDANVVGKDRNQMVKAAIKDLKCVNNLVMAQPFTDQDLRSAYQIEPVTTVWLNDKENLSDYIPAQHLPKEYFHFFSGKEFSASIDKVPLPCVVKMTSSSAGDGVRICHTPEDLMGAKDAFGNLDGHVMVYEFIQSTHNFCIQFGVPADSSKEIEIIGFNEQLIGKCGEFLGGMVTPQFDRPELHKVFALMKEEILPKVRAKGWYGVGGLDVLMNEKGDFFFIDPNFRMTATFVFVCQVRNKQIKKSLLGFTGMFKGTEAEFREKILPISKLGTPEQCLNIASLTYSLGVFRFNAALVFDETMPKEKVAKKLLDLGVQSTTLECLCN